MASLWSALLALLLAACGGSATPEPLRIAGADAERGQAAIERYGCGACHRIPGVAGARGLVGPPLDHYGERALIAGQLPNRPAILIAWILDPPALIPATGMPDLDVSPRDARDIAAYLYSLRPDEAMVWPPDVPPERSRR
jgi:cytochrome c1